MAEALGEYDGTSGMADLWSGGPSEYEAVPNISSWQQLYNDPTCSDQHRDATHNNSYRSLMCRVRRRLVGLDAATDQPSFRQQQLISVTLHGRQLSAAAASLHANSVCLLLTSTADCRIIDLLPFASPQAEADGSRCCNSDCMLQMMLAMHLERLIRVK